MARVKLSEYRAKQLLVDSYDGVPIQLGTIDKDIDQLSESESYVVKVDQGVKKRGKQGLLEVGVAKNDVYAAVQRLASRGFTRFIAEPLVTHDDLDERYLSFERTKDGIVMRYSEHGGVDVEDHSDSILHSTNTSDIPLPKEFLDHSIDTMNAENMSFVEINPLVVREGTCVLLDAAVLVDSAAEMYATWSFDDVVEARSDSDAERAIAELNANSTAALSFRVLNPNGAVWLLLSGGGASITIADEAYNAGRSNVIGNYGEYSGGPTSEETYLYTTQVLGQMFQSDAPKLALVIAGGVANFTDVKKTFAGIIKALTELLDECRKHKVKVFVRRGGPNEAEGLAMMQAFLEKNDLFGSVHGSDILLTDVIHEALEYIDA